AAELAVAAGFALLCAIGGRLRGPSVVAACFVAHLLGAYSYIGFRLHWGIDIASIGAVLVAARALGLDRSRLERLGIGAWSPDDIAVAPTAAAWPILSN